MMRREIPGVLWVSLIVLGLISVIQLSIGVARGYAPLLIGVVLNIVLMVGLYHGRRWAFVVLLVFAVLGVFATLAWNPAAAVGVLVCNGLVAVPVILARDYFWAPTSQPGTRRPNYCGRCGHDLRGVRELHCPNCGIEIRPA